MTFPGAADAAWALSDTNFTGRYDVRLKFGYAFERESVSIRSRSMQRSLPESLRVYHPIDLTSRWSQPLAAAMFTFNSMKQLSTFATFAPASGGSALSR